MAQVIPVGDPVNEAERRTIAHLRDTLPDDYLLVHNFEIERGDEIFEIDLAVIAPHAVYLVDTKGTRGFIDVYGSRWYPEGRQPFVSPLIKLRGHAKTLKGLLTDSQPSRQELRDIFVDAAIILAAPDAVLQDSSGRDSDRVTSLKNAGVYFRNKAAIPGKFSKNICRFHKLILQALLATAKKRTGLIQFGNWVVDEQLGGTSHYTEYRAFNSFAGKKSGSVILRVYRADPYLPKDEREQQRARIANSYQSLSSMPGHPGIISVRDFFATESEDQYILVIEDVQGQAIRLNIEKPSLALTQEQKFRIARDLLGALSHAHAHSVVHRNITPSSLLVGADGQLRLSGFDYARTGTDRTHTIAGDIIDELETSYQAPEVYREPANASPASDIFSAGIILFELFTGEKPFSSPTELFEKSAVFAEPPSGNIGGAPTGFDEWLQSLCSFEPEDRPEAERALHDLLTLLEEPTKKQNSKPVPEEAEASPALDYGSLKPGVKLTHKYVVQERLGKPGSFGVVYKCVDTLGDVNRAIKLILRDRHSTLERLKKEYRTLLRVPDHPRVVKVIDADLLPNEGPPFIVFEYIDGLDVGEMIECELFSPGDVLDLAKQAAEGLVHLHRHGIFHCDIKPRNLLWTNNGVRIIDFNVSVRAESEDGKGGGSRRYLPPDLDLNNLPQNGELADRDLYALGVTLYEALTGRYPWDASTPPPGQTAKDPRDCPGLTDLNPDFAAIVLKAIAPKRADRFASVPEFEEALKRIPRATRVSSELTAVLPNDALANKQQQSNPNTNPFVSTLTTLYSQSPNTNSGTRGLDAAAELTYVATALDNELAPAILSGEFRLVVITGNAGDGKTAFLQRLEKEAKSKGASFGPDLRNGSSFDLKGRRFLTNHDGSQDEGEHTNEEVLSAFFGPYEGADPEQWSKGETRLIAINEGRLVDFLSSNQTRFPVLSEVILEGLSTGTTSHEVAVVNLNLRSVVGGNPEGAKDDYSIFTRLVQRLTDKRFWQACKQCDLKERCYAYHNAATFQDDTAGPKVLGRLKSLYTLTHLRGKMHITLRDLRSALAFMLVGGRDCQDIHGLYERGDAEAIIQSFYFNSWMGGDRPNADRLLSLLKEVDVGAGSDPRLDRNIAFQSPTEDLSLFRFDRRPSYDHEVLRSRYDLLPRALSGRPSEQRSTTHQLYVAAVKRRAFFERRNQSWKAMLPYRSAEKLLRFIDTYADDKHDDALLDEIIHAINRGEGLSDPARLGGHLALQVREVDRGTIRSYRVFSRERLSLHLLRELGEARFIEAMPTGVRLVYQGPSNLAELRVNLDVFEMLERLNDGYQPSVEEQQGYYLSLSVFKNLLSSEPYQEVLLTITGQDFHKVARQSDGRLVMQSLEGGGE